MGENQSTPEELVCLTSKEWDEIEACAMALHAALSYGVEDEGLELLRSVQKRFSQALSSIRARLEMDSQD